MHGKSTKVSGSREDFPVTLPKSAIHKIEIIAITPKWWQGCSLPCLKLN